MKTLLETLRSRYFQLQRIEKRVTAEPKYWTAVGNLIRRTAAPITDSSRANLETLASLHPQATEKAIEVLHQRGGRIEKIIVPSGLAGTALAFSVNEKGVARLGNGAARAKNGAAKATPYEPQPMAELITSFDKEKKAFARDPEYAALFLYKTILRVRVELYKAGEERSARKKQGLPLAADPFQEVCTVLSSFLGNFPFSVERDKESLQKAVDCLQGKGNNVAADTGLQYLTGRLVKRLDELMVRRLRYTRPAQNWKISLIETGEHKGDWIVNQVGYRLTPSGLLRRESIPHRVSTAKLLSMIGKEQKKITQELDDNKVYLEQIKAIAADPLGQWPELLELHERFTSFFAWHKDKACVELEAALHVTLVGSDQAVRLAQSLLGVAEDSLNLRQEVLAVQAKRIGELKREAEKKIIDHLMAFAVSIVENLADPRSLTSSRWLGWIESRLDDFLKTFLRDEMRDPWLIRCKGRVDGLQKALPKLYDPTLTREEKVAKLRKGASYILQLGFFFETRNEPVTNVPAWQRYIHRYKKLLDKLDQL
ncbi:MAG: hypothetical protein WC632_04975 [Candidatus Margulisiibacteriota bacterium]